MPRKSRYAFKPFTFPSGKVKFVQGYENMALESLLKEFSEDEILVCEECPHYIPYFWYGKTRKYNPDFFIPKENLYIEIKSEYTYNKQKRKTQAKLKACRNIGYDTRLVVYKSRRGEILLLENISANEMNHC